MLQTIQSEIWNATLTLSNRAVYKNKTVFNVQSNIKQTAEEILLEAAKEYFGSLENEIVKLQLNISNKTEENEGDIRNNTTFVYTFEPQLLPSSVLIQSFLKSEIKVFMKQPDYSMLFYSYFDTFTPSLMTAILMFLMMLALLLKLFEAKRIRNNTDTSLGAYFLTSMQGIWAQGSQVTDFYSESGRILALFVFIFGYTFSTLLVSIVTSQLTTMAYDIPFDSLEGAIVSSKYDLCLVRDQKLIVDYFKTTRSQTEDTDFNHYITDELICVESDETLTELLCDRGTLAIVETTSWMPALQRRLGINDVNCPLSMSGKHVYVPEPALVCVGDCAVKEEINKIIIRIQESGVEQYIRKRHFAPKLSQEMPQKVVESFDLVQSRSAFELYCVGCTAALILCCLELAWSNSHKLVQYLNNTVVTNVKNKIHLINNR